MSSIIFIPSLELIEIIIKSLEEKKGIKCFFFFLVRKKNGNDTHRADMYSSVS